MFILWTSSLNIFNSTFTDNSVANGGVMYICPSSFNITDSTFTNNGATIASGITFATFFNI